MGRFLLPLLAVPLSACGLRPSEPRADDTVQVVVAARTIQRWDVIQVDDLALVTRKPRYLPDGVFLTPDALVGRIPTAPLLPGEMVRGERLVGSDGGGLTAWMGRGQRAMSFIVPRDAVGFFGLGNGVDVEASGGSARCLLILASWRIDGAPGAGPSTAVMVELTPEIAERIADPEGRVVQPSGCCYPVHPSETPIDWNLRFQGTTYQKFVAKRRRTSFVRMTVAQWRTGAPAEAAAQEPIDCIDLTVFAEDGSASTTPYDVDGLPCEMAETWPKRARLPIVQGTRPKRAN